MGRKGDKAKSSPLHSFVGEPKRGSISVCRTHNKENGTQLNFLSFGASLFIAFLKGRGFFVYEGVDGVLSSYYVWAGNARLLALFSHFTFLPIKENVDQAENMGSDSQKMGFQT